MGRHHPTRLVKTCAHCGQGYDAFKAMEARGHFCSPDCLAADRLAKRRIPGTVAEAVISLGADVLAPLPKANVA